VSGFVFRGVFNGVSATHTCAPTRITLESE
jgi:hypothetical protein